MQDKSSATGPAELVLWDVSDGIATLTFNRPARNNAFTTDMEHQYFDLLERAANDSDVRVIIVTGAGRSFSPGLDMEALRIGVAEGGLATSRPRRPHTYPVTIPKPIIAVINGACAGLGLVVAMMCDIRFAARGAKMTTAWSRRGLVAEHGMSWMIPRLVGFPRALELMMSGRVFTTDEAHDMGMVHHVADADRVMTDARTYALDIAANVSPISLAHIKWQSYRDLERSSLNAAWQHSMFLAHDANEFPDATEGVSSFIERRPPNFRPIPPNFDVGARVRRSAWD
jgi:enoyl-CoA hydratase/carnithine racemase